ncbi:hypothetical protein C8Q78DRAFT_1044942 [Trametes maxima]|nr:hypothetical protein C8Q78DRAFT_1044942 [Trametes maxima]
MRRREQRRGGKKRACGKISPIRSFRIAHSRSVNDPSDARTPLVADHGGQESLQSSSLYGLGCAPARFVCLPPRCRRGSRRTLLHLSAISSPACPLLLRDLRDQAEVRRKLTEAVWERRSSAPRSRWEREHRAAPGAFECFCAFKFVLRGIPTG